MIRWNRIFSNVLVRPEHVSAVRIQEGQMVFELAGDQGLISDTAGFQDEDALEMVLFLSRESPDHQERMAKQRVRGQRKRTRK